MTTVALGDILKKASSNITQKDLANHEGEYPIYGASGLIKHVDFFQQSKPYLAVVKDGAVGQVMLLPAKSSVIGTLQYLIPKSATNISYLYYALSAIDFERYKVGAVIPHIYFKDYKDELIKLPDAASQSEIVSVLNKIDSLIEIAHQLNSCFDDLIKSRFVEMFGDPILNTKGWNTCLLKDVCKVTSSKRIYQSDLVQAGIPFYKISDFTKMILNGDNSCSAFISEATYKKLTENDFVPVAGDILFTARGTIGLCYIVKPDDNFYFQDGMISWIHIKANDFLASFLIKMFENESFRTNLTKNTSGSTVSYLSIKQLQETKVILPPIDLQKKYGKFIQQVDKSRLEVQKIVDQLQTLKASLMQQYFH